MPTIRNLGVTQSGKTVLGGAFQMFDTQGMPLSVFMQESAKHHCAVSFAHYFASAMEHGWDEKQTFAKIAEAFSDYGHPKEAKEVQDKCVAIFMQAAKECPEGSDAVHIGKYLREKLEKRT